MDKGIWKLIGEWPFFLDNVLVGVRIVFLPNYPLILSPLKHRSVRTFLNQENEESKQENPLNNIIDKDR